MKILLTGASGQLGHNLIATKPSYASLCPNKSELIWRIRFNVLMSFKI